ncbi:MAG: D-amino-acid transaminase [Alphaproteobacteria bacterium]|nr:D-amino-acid transaminase [Alphaproteobacteria bacterium]
MSEIAYVNGRYVLTSDAMVNIEDRGYQFSDGVYEVIAVANHSLVDLDPHLERLDRSLSNLNIEWPCSERVLRIILAQLLKRNRLKDGIVYLQVTRGVAPRNHAFPTAIIPSSLVISVSRAGRPSRDKFIEGVKVVTTPENRWGRPDIKSVSLLPNVLAKQFAVHNGAFETWFVDDHGAVTEGSSTNAWIVLSGQEIVTRPLGNDILAGITRMKLIELARAGNMRITERPFSLDEAMNAEEAFITSTTAFVMPVVEIDENVVGTGKPGPVTQNLLALYEDHFSQGDEK